MFLDTFMQLCVDKGVSPNKACLDMGLSRTAVSKWKSGGKPNGTSVSKIAEYFDVSTDYLLGKTDGSSTVLDEDNNIVTIDRETRDMIDSLRTRPEMKVLFSVSKKATKEDILQAVKIIQALKDGE